MVQVCPCVLGSGLLGSMLYMMLDNNMDSHDNFVNSLNIEQKMKYQMIKEDRYKTYVIGMIFGVILSLILQYFFINKIRNYSNISKACLYAVVVMSTAHFYYLLSPKKDYIIKHLDNKVQIELWHKLYQDMQSKQYKGYIFGIFGFILIILGLNMSKWDNYLE